MFSANVRSIAAARFSDILADLPLPSAQLAGMAPSFAGYSANLQRRNDILCRETLTGWRDRLKNVEQAGFDARTRKYPTALKALLSAKVAERVLEFVPTPSLEPVKAGDEAPIQGCAYDAFVGIYEFYYFLEELDPDSSPERAVSRYGSYDEGKWETVVQSARDVCAKLGTFVSYRNAGGVAGTLARLVATIDVPDGGNEIGRALKFADEILREKDAWAAGTFRTLCANAGTGRAEVLAKGVALLLGESIDREAAAELAREWKNFKRGITKWNGTETAALDIFNEALPGMPAHRKAWLFIQKEGQR